MPQDWFAANAPKAPSAPAGDWFASNAPKTESAPPSPETASSVHPHASLGRGVWNVLSAIPGGLYDLAADVAPYDASGNLKMPMGNTASALWNAHAQTGSGAIDALQRGDYATAARKGANTLIPALGPAMDASTDKMMQGNVAEGIGEVVTNAALTASGMRPRVPTTTTRGPRVRPNLNPKEAEAVAFARQQNIPLDAGTATGSSFIKAVQEKAANTYGGARTAERLQGLQDEALARTSGDALNTAAPRPTNPVAAGEGVRNALTKLIQDLHARASKSYDSLRSVEEAQQKASPTRTPLAVDVSAAMKELWPLYTELKRQAELNIPMQGAKGRTLAALDGLMNGPSVARLSAVDAALSDLKAMARGADMPELRTTGQATAAQAVQKLDAQVRAAAAKAGPDVLKALEDGRAATRQKYVVADVLDMLSGEPGQVFRQLTQNKDVGLERLKAVQRLAPNEMLNVGRAFLEDLFQQATEQGGWTHADRLYANWQKLGTQTKQALFPKKGQIEALDNFFLIQKRIKEVKNPSGTAKVAGVLDVMTGIPAWALSKMLMTPQGVKWLTDARIVSKSPSKASRTLALSNVTKAAQSAGVPLEAIPALAEEPETPAPSGTRR